MSGVRGIVRITCPACGKEDVRMGAKSRKILEHNRWNVAASGGKFQQRCAAVGSTYKIPSTRE